MKTTIKISAIALAAYLALIGGVAFPGQMVSSSNRNAPGVVTGRVEGRVMFGGQPVEGARVYVSKDAQGILARASEKAPAVTGRTGEFSLELPKGRYYIAAKKGKGSGPVEPGDIYCFYGGNPVVVDPGSPARIVLNSVMKPETLKDTESTEDKGAVEGVVTLDGKPLDGVLLNVYPDAKGYFRGRGVCLQKPTGADGRFKISLADGTWYIMARKRMNGDKTGPLYEGDYFGYLDTNPVIVKNGTIKHVELPVAKKIEKTSPGGHGYTHIAGVVRDEQGKPAPGIYVCLYRHKVMSGRPAIISKPTTPDGVFAMDLPIDGTFYLGARSTLGGPLGPGQSCGKYSGNPDHSITIEAGKTIEGLGITLEKVQDN